jgi:hypothetical protein
MKLVIEFDDLACSATKSEVALALRKEQGEGSAQAHHQDSS